MDEIIKLDGHLFNRFGKMRILSTDSKITKIVKNDWNNLSEVQFRNKYFASKELYLKRVIKYEDPYKNSPLAIAGKILTRFI